MKKIIKKLVVGAIIVLVVAVLGIGFILLNTVREETPEEGLLLPYVPKEGEERNIHVFTGYRNGTGVKDVKITITESETGISLVQISDEEGLAVFSITVGNNYTITATFNNSTESITSVIGPKHVIDVYISGNTVDLILCYEAGII